jgi:hypothetical protein
VGWRRRTGALLALLLGVLLGTTGPAAAAFSATRPLAAVTVSTVVVQAPPAVTAQEASCSQARFMSVRVSWTPSSSPGVSGYAVKAFRSDGQISTVARTDASGTSAAVTVDKMSSGSTTVSFGVVTETGYGWTAESARSAQATC